MAVIFEFSRINIVFLQRKYSQSCGQIIKLVRSPGLKQFIAITFFLVSILRATVTDLGGVSFSWVQSGVQTLCAHAMSVQTSQLIRASDLISKW